MLIIFLFSFIFNAFGQKLPSYITAKNEQQDHNCSNQSIERVGIFGIISEI